MSTKRLIVISLIIVFALGSCTSVVMLLRRDDPPPNDGDLRPTRLEIPDDENAFTYFDKACDALAWPEGEEEELKIDAIFDGEEWDAEFVERLLKKNDETFKWRDEGLARARMQVPELDQGFNTLLPYLSPWRKIAKLSRLRALYLAKSGDEAGALDEAMKNVMFGRKAQEGRGAIIHYVVAVAVKKIGLRTIREVLPETKLKADALNDLVKQLRLLGPDAEGLANAVRVEYAASCDAIDRIAARGAPGVLGLELPFPLNQKSRFLFKPNRTKRLSAETFRMQIGRIGKTYKEQKKEELPPTVRDAIDNRNSRSKLLLSGNPVGIVIFQFMCPTLTRLPMVLCDENVSVAATRLLIAIKRYKMKTGKLPETLDALVPEYIDAVPADDFDGQPMRYSPEKKLIWSVNENLKDDGGDKDADIIFEIEF